MRGGAGFAGAGSGYGRRLDGAHQGAEAPALPAPGAGMSDLPQGPRIGADEWVARADERFATRTGLAGAVERAVARVHPAIRFGVLVTAAGVFGIATSDQYYQRVGFNTLYYALLALRSEERRVG